MIFFFHLLCYRTPVLFFSHPHISMVTFVVAFLHLCFENSNIITLSSIGSLTGVIAALGVWCIWRFWEKHPVSDVQPSEKLFSFEKNDDSERRSKKFTFEVVVPESLEGPQSSTSHQSWTLNSLCHLIGPPFGVSQTMLKNLNILFYSFMALVARCTLMILMILIRSGKYMY